MDWLDSMNHAMDYIEENLTETIDFERTARIAGCSTYHFQRMFSFITGVPLSEYIRRRRLSLAAFEIQNTNIKIIDLAYRYGYESPEAFSRAFSRLHGVTPMSARSKGVALKAYPRMSFQISIKGDSEMNYRIEEKDAFEVFGLELQTSVLGGQCYKEIPAFWNACANDGRIGELARTAGKEQGDLMDAGVTYAHNPNGNMNYMIGCMKKEDMDCAEFTVLSIPKQTWAVFSVLWKEEQDDGNIHEVWRRIYAEWFPMASYEHADCDYDLEIYFGNRNSECGIEIWIPVIKK